MKYTPRESKGLIEFSEQHNKTKKMIIITKDIEKEEIYNKKKIVYILLWKWLLLPFK